ncbi:MAG: hypothetical protein NTX79_01960 [Candidatus Micrarchaeota archaeon]|nr:hypothetical protein [Candidatus Micrarchaeota archaeon]
MEKLNQVEPEKVAEKNPEPLPVISVSGNEKDIVAPAREINFESMKLLASGDTRLTTFEIIALYTGWPIHNAIADEKKAQRFVENANSWLPKLNLPKISETSTIKHLMAAMLPLQDANAVKSKFYKFSPASDQLFVTVNEATTFYEANKGMVNGKYFISKDRTGQLWAFELPKVYIGHDGNEIDIAKRVSGKDNIVAVMTTPLGNVKEIEIQGLKQKPGSSIHVLDIDPSAWKTFVIGERNSNYTSFGLKYDNDGRIQYLEGEYLGGHIRLTNLLVLDYQSRGTDPRPNWLGLLVAGLHHDNEYLLQPLYRDRNHISAGHPQSLPMDVIIDTAKISSSSAD